MITIVSWFASCVISAIGWFGMYTYNVDTRLYGIPAYYLSFYRVSVFLRYPTL